MSSTISDALGHMEEPLLQEDEGAQGSGEFERRGRFPSMKIPTKSDHDTCKLLMSPRQTSFITPTKSPRQPVSFLSYMLDNEQGRRTEKFYVPPVSVQKFYQQFGQSPLSPGERRSPAYLNEGFSPTSSGVATVNGENGMGELPTNIDVNDLEAQEELQRDKQRRHMDRHNEYFPSVEGGEEIPDNSAADSISEEVDASYSKASLYKSKSVNGRNKLHKCRTAPVLSGFTSSPVEHESHSQIYEETSQMSSVVWQASTGLLIYLSVGVMIYIWKKDEFRGVETVGWIDALYFCIVTMCTIGYGDITPITPTAKLLSCALVLVGFGFIDALMSGMVTFVLDRQEDLLMEIVVKGDHEKARGYVLNAKKGTIRVRLKVFLAVGALLLSLTVGTLFCRYMENFSWIDSLYVTCISITTVGYGDYSFQTMWGRLFAAVWLLLSTLCVARAFLFLAEARVHKRHRRIAKSVLQSKMTAAEIKGADLDDDGLVSVSEFVICKLKAMKKVRKDEILEIVELFNKIDVANVGKITMTQLLEAEAENYYS